MRCSTWLFATLFASLTALTMAAGLEDTETIKALLKKERYYRDTLQTEKMRACYNPDVNKTYVSVSVFSGNADEFAAMSLASTPVGIKIIHTIDPVLIHFNGARAVAQSNGKINMRFLHNGEYFEMVTWCRAISRIERIRGEWFMDSLEVIYNRDMISGTDPINNQNLDLTGIDKFRTSYRYLSWYFGLQNRTVPNDLPGEDDQTTVTPVFDRVNGWLAGGPAVNPVYGE